MIERLKEIEEEIATCHKCQFSRTRQETVPGWIPDYAQKLVFIGSGPSPLENVSGIPLIGREGFEFTEIIKEIFELGRKDYNILYCVKCMPVYNGRKQQPQKNEIFWCAKYLFEQLEILSPDLIITLGKTAFETLMIRQGTNFLTLKDNISNYSGVLYKVKSLLNSDIEWNLVGTYDPGGWMRSDKNYDLAIDNLKKAKGYYNAITSGQSVEALYGNGPSL